MRAYWTILLDSYRMLKSRSIFWLSLIITILAAVFYLSIGFDEDGVSFLFGFGSIENSIFVEGAEQSTKLYVAIFTKLIVEYWLSFVAIGLALVSCSSIFPQSLDEGEASSLLSKKPSRLKVFAAKFSGSLLFVLIQVTIFVVIVFVAMKLRLGSWNPTIFWYVPLVLLVFVYLYSFMTLVAVKTQSAMTAFFVTILLWSVSWILGTVAVELERATRATEEIWVSGVDDLRDPSPDLTEAEKSGLELWNDRVGAVYHFFPKTGLTLSLGDDLLVIDGRRGIAKGSFFTVMAGLAVEGISGNEADEIFDELEEKESVFSPTYVLGTSLAFSMTMLVLAAWLFSRKEI